MPRTFLGRQLTITDQTRDAFWLQAGQNSQTYQTANGPQLHFQCISCQGWFVYEALQLGHRVDWAAWFVQQGITEQNSSFAQAQAAFNDLANLAVQCATCNTGHAFEGDSDDEGSVHDDNDMIDVEDYEHFTADGDLADLVVPDCPNCNSAETEFDDTTGNYTCSACNHVFADPAQMI